MGEPQLSLEPPMSQTMRPPARMVAFQDAVRGYNHQIPHCGQVFHVQSEDSGSAKRHIFTHVFLSGTIIASTRTDYGEHASSADIGMLLKKSQKSMLHRLVHGLLDDDIARCSSRSDAKERARAARPQLEVVPPHVGGSSLVAPIVNEARHRAPRILPDSPDLEPINDVLRALHDAVSGTLGVVLVDRHSGRCICTAGSGIDLEVAGRGGARVMKAHDGALRRLGQQDALEDMLITAQTQFHILRPVDSKVLLCLVIQRDRGNLALARHKLEAAAIDPRIESDSA